MVLTGLLPTRCTTSEPSSGPCLDIWTQEDPTFLAVFTKEKSLFVEDLMEKAQPTMLKVSLWMKKREKKPTKLAVKRSALAVCLVKGDDLDKNVLASFQSPDRAMKQPLKCGNCGGIHDTDDDMTSEAEDSSLDDTDMAFWGSPDD